MYPCLHQIDKTAVLLYDPDIEKKGRYCVLMRIRN
jgi:hypothetical protein